MRESMWFDRVGTAVQLKTPFREESRSDIVSMLCGIRCDYLMYKLRTTVRLLCTHARHVSVVPRSG
jgi:hypothetical protein